MYYSADYGVIWTQMDVDPSNTSGDQKSRDHNIQAAWHDKDNEIIWFVDCDNDGSDTDFDVWKLDYSTWGSFSITEVGSSTASSLVYAMDIFKISTDTFVICRELNVCKVYDVDSAPFTEKDSLILWLYGFFGGGYSFGGRSNVIDYIDLVTVSGNASDKGDLTVTRNGVTGCAGTVYGFFGGGSTGSNSNVIDYINITLTSGNASDKGDLTVARPLLASCSGTTYGFFSGGFLGVGSVTNVIDYINITTTSGNASDKGDLTNSRADAGGVNNSTYGFFGGGDHDGFYSPTNIIDYINITTTSGNATDKGDLTVSRCYLASGVNGSNYGFFGGGYNGGCLNVIDYIDVTTTSGNATDKGDLTVSRRQLTGVSGYGSNYGFFGGGATAGSVWRNYIDYIDVTTTSGNATDKGDLTQSRGQLGGARA